MFLLLLFFSFSISLKAQQWKAPVPTRVGDITEQVTKGKVYKRKITYPGSRIRINPKLRFNNSITPQGMAIYDGKMYQFRNGGYCQVVDMSSMSQVESFYIPMASAPTYANAMHMGAVAFSNEYSTEPGYTKEEGGLPYLYVMLGDNRIFDGERYGTVAVYDINHNYDMLSGTLKQGAMTVRTPKLIRYFRLTLGGMTVPNFIAAFDFTNNKGWLFGYDEEKKSGATALQTADFLVREFRFKQSGDGDISSQVTYAGNSFLVEARCGNLQDCCFSNGLVYLSTGGSVSKKNPMDAHVAIYDTSQRAITNKISMGTKQESEGIDLFNGFIYQTIHAATSHIIVLAISPY